MDKEIETFKKQNGNITYTEKELLGAIHTKLDRIEKRLSKGDKNFVKIQTTMGFYKKLVMGLYGSLLGLLMLILKLTKVI